MPASATFPVDADYSSGMGREGNLLRGRVESAREFRRQKAAPRRIVSLVFLRRPRADWILIENFYLQYLTDFFTWHDKSSALGAFAGRKYSMYFHAEPQVVEVGFEQYDIRVELIEAVGVAMNTYPDFAGNFPSVNILVASAVDLGGNGKLFTYAGFGYRVNGSFTQIYLDELLTGGENPKTDVVLGLHRVRVVGGTPTSLDFLI